MQTTEKSRKIKVSASLILVCYTCIIGTSTTTRKFRQKIV